MIPHLFDLFTDNLCIRRVHPLRLHDERSDGICPYHTRRRIDYAVDTALYLHIDGRILKRKRCIDELAVLHHKILNITHALQALDRTVNQCQILRIPAQIFAGNHR